jgi:hypothetical protein
MDRFAALALEASMTTQISAVAPHERPAARCILLCSPFAVVPPGNENNTGAYLTSAVFTLHSK